MGNREGSRVETGPVPGGGDVRVLLVDDDPGSRQAVGWLLEAAGLVVVAQASDAHAALVAVGRAAPTVVVMDLRVHRSGTFGLLTLLLKLGQAAPGVGVVVHTATVDTEVVTAVSEAGAVAVLPKGGSGDALVAAVRAAHAAGGHGRAAGTGAG